MTVGIGTVLLLLASILLGAVLLLAAFGIILWVSRHQRRTPEESEGRVWKGDPTEIAVRDVTSIVVPGK